MGLNELELTVSDFEINRVHAGGVDLDQYVVLPDLRVRHFASPHAIGASITIDDECFHVFAGLP
jgi:hypothetical protein